MQRILVVDDEPHVTRLIQKKLRSEGYDAVTACNGMDALAKLSKDGPFDAVVTDYNMPKMDGRQLCESIRERYSGEDIRIFLVTARLEEPLREWAEGLPRVEYIEKPISLQDLLGRLAKSFTPTEDEEAHGDV
jgi:CheY-like chemotaxis protein